MLPNWPLVHSRITNDWKELEYLWGTSERLKFLLKTESLGVVRGGRQRKMVWNFFPYVASLI